MNKMVVEHGGDVATAVLSHSVAVRTVVALLSMWNRGIRSFSPGQLSQALQFLEVAPESRSEVLERVVRMRIQLSRNVSASEASVDLPKIADRMEALLLQRLPALRAGRKR
jgi:hypothetical protein